MSHSLLSPQEYRSATSLPDVGETGDVRRDSRSATVAMATEGGASAQDPGDDDVVEYEEGFKMVEKCNIISVSGTMIYCFVFCTHVHNYVLEPDDYSAYLNN